MDANLRHVPFSDPQPDANRFVDIVMGRADGSRPPLVEYLVDNAVMKPIVTELLGREWVPPGPESFAAYLDMHIDFWLRMGYDFVRFETGLPFERKSLVGGRTALDVVDERGWPDEHSGTITSWEDFERFRWPEVTDESLAALEYVNGHLPEGMGLIASHGGGPFEIVSQAMSLEGICLAVKDDPELVRAVADRVGETMVRFYERLLQLDRLVMVFPGDDMGFRTGTLLHPDDLRAYFLPWHKRFAEMAHENGLPYCLHSCGNILPIVEDLIDDVKLDGKHSYEDVILPIQDFQARYGRRMAVLGGFDIHPLSVASPEEVRRHARFLMETCGARGRFAIGSGSSIPSYTPVENYLALVDEAADFRLS